jgi:hypothetical protein
VSSHGRQEWLDYIAALKSKNTADRHGRDQTRKENIMDCFQCGDQDVNSFKGKIVFSFFGELSWAAGMVRLYCRGSGIMDPLNSKNCADRHGRDQTRKENIMDCFHCGDQEVRFAGSSYDRRYSSTVSFAGHINDDGGSSG